MKPSRSSRILKILISVATLCSFLLVVGAQSKVPAPSAVQSKQSQKDTAPPAQPPAQESGYVGAEACKVCHEDIYNSYEKTPHWQTTYDTRGGPSKQGCEACHGPGKEHSETADKTKIFTFKNTTADEISKRCLTCHASGKDQMQFGRAVHFKNNVSCLDCHSPHHAKVSESMLVKATPELCYTCHAQQKPQFAMPFHHRVNEGLVQCNDCHNPHGTVQENQLRTSAAQDAVCFKCHADKRGPFVYEHEVVKVEGCQSCHTPHGSPNMHMLRVSNVNLLCLSCHTTSSFSNAPGAPSFHNQATQYQACTICHSQIHGSNFDHVFFK